MYVLGGGIYDVLNLISYILILITLIMVEPMQKISFYFIKIILCDVNYYYINHL